MSRAGLLRAFALVAFLTAPGLGAQQRPPSRLEIRTDHHLTGIRSTEGGVGFFLPVSTYLRAGGVVAAGVARGTAGGTRRTARAEGAIRFHLDPFRERRLGVALGGGVVARWTEDDGVEPFLLALVDIEGRGAWTPAIQVALGGGLRVGVLLRPGQPGSR